VSDYFGVFDKNKHFPLVTSPEKPLCFFTDGSFKNDVSAWSVVMANDWFDQNFASLPDEKNIHVADLSQVCQLSDVIDSSINYGIYGAELTACIRALLTTPCHLDVKVVSDNQASVKAIQSFETLTHREKLRSNGRTFMFIIQKIIAAREGEILFQHVKSHTNLKDENSSGNKLADYFAQNAADNQVECKYQQLPLASLGEINVSVYDNNGKLITGDVRRTVGKRVEELKLVEWQSSQSQSLFACEQARGFMKFVLKHSNQLLLEKLDFNILVQVVMNTWHYKPFKKRKDASDQFNLCSACNQICSMTHLLLHCKCPMMATCKQALLQDLKVLMKENGSASSVTIFGSVDTMFTSFEKCEQVKMQESEKVLQLIGCISNQFFNFLMKHFKVEVNNSGVIELKIKIYRLFIHFMLRIAKCIK
jgi:ribonuclease HI